jgi:competence protein ComEC
LSKFRLAALWVACGAGGVGAGSFSTPPTELRFLAVGQGDCAVFRHAGATLLVDAGPHMHGYDAGARIVLPKLRKMGVRSVDLIVVTHPHADHLGGAGSVLREFPQARLAMPEGFRDHPETQAQLREWKLPAERVLWLGREERLRIDRARIRIHCPPYGPGVSVDDGSLFLRLDIDGAAAVFTGDAGKEVETRTSRLGDWSAQVLQVGHHGSRTSSSEAWLRTVKPEYSIVSCGRDNSYGHPHRDVIETLSRAGTKILRTDQEGDLIFEVRDGKFVRRGRVRGKGKGVRSKE